MVSTATAFVVLGKLCVSLGLFRDVANFQQPISPDPQSLRKTPAFHSLRYSGDLTNGTQFRICGEL